MVSCSYIEKKFTISQSHWNRKQIVSSSSWCLRQAKKINLSFNSC